MSEEVKPVYIVGGGPSLRGFDWSLLDGKDVIAVNKAYQVLPNAQMIYFTDRDFWERHKDRMLAHGGTLMRGVLRPNHEPQHPKVRLWHLTGPQGIETKPGCLRHGSNSVFAVLNMCAVHLKRKKIYLLGVDMKWGEKGNKATTHWHEGYQKEGGRTDPEIVYSSKMIRSYESIAKPLESMGVEVINVNTPEQTALKVFPIQSFETVFNTKDTHPNKCKTVKRVMVH